MNTREFRSALRSQRTKFLVARLGDWRAEGAVDLGRSVEGARMLAMLRAELMRRGVRT